MRRLLVALVVLAVAAAAGVFAFVGGGSSGAFEVEAATTKTMAIRSERTEFKMTVEIVGHSIPGQTIPGQTIHMSGSGLMNNVTRLSQLTIHEGEPQSVVVEERVDSSHGRMIVYVKQGGDWKKLDMGAAMKAQGIDTSAVMQSNSDPTQTLRLVRAAANSVRKLGSDDVRGVSMPHFRAHVLLARYGALFPAAQRSGAKKLIETLRTKFGMHDYDIDLWIGPDKFVHRMAFALTLEEPNVGREHIAMTMDLYDFNVAAPVTLPKVG